MNTNVQAKVIKLPKINRQPKVKAQSKAAIKAAKMKLWAAIGTAFVASTITVLSLKHLAHGIQISTGDGTIESVAMAIGIDCGMIVAEFAMLTNVGNKKISMWANPFVIGALLLSAGMNTYAFAEHATGTAGLIVSGLMGFGIPAAIYCLLRIGAQLHLGSKT